MAGDCVGTRRELTAGADPNALGDQGTMPLQVAIVYGLMELVDVMFGGGADFNRTDPHGNGPLWTAVHQACLASRSEAHLASVRQLLAGGADPDHQNRYGSSPRAIAIQRDDTVAALFPSPRM